MWERTVRRRYEHVVQSPPLNVAVRILIVGHTAEASERAAEVLTQAGMVNVTTSDRIPTELISEPNPFQKWAKPEVIMVTHVQVLDDLSKGKPESGGGGSRMLVPIVLFTASDAEFRTSLDCYSTGKLGLRVVGIVRPSDSPARVASQIYSMVLIAQYEVRMDALARIHAISVEQGDGVDALRRILEIATLVMGFERSSMVAYIEGSDAGYVIAATDAPEATQFAVSIAKYPEIQAALDCREPVLLGDAQEHPLTEPVADLLANVDVRGMAVYPCVWKQTPLGVVMFRNSQAGIEHVDEDRDRFARVLVNHVALCLHNGKVMESLRESTTHRLSRARYEAERRLRTIESLKEHFEAAADGVLILDAQGCILFVNRAAEKTLGFSREDVMGTDIVGLVRVEDEPLIKQVIERVIKGQNISAFDLDLLTLSGETICASATTSTVLGPSGAAVLTFRDVTAQRALEGELRRTKEFLERLVDSTVDAIVAADMRGNIIVFNQGAERIYGYVARDVIGQISVWNLYSDGVAKQIMRMLRSTQYGGVGRLEQTRREIRTSSKELIPVNMTASIIYQDGREVATVGIFSDLRERIRIERRLLQAQEKLQLTEKQALVAELAGAAAHELNQPLTSIMGYAELLLHRAKSDGSNPRGVEVILSEAERMAEIVKKIGRITKYETTEYVGSTRMLDLNRSARAATAEPGLYRDGGSSLEETVPSDPLSAHTLYRGGVEHPNLASDFEDEITGLVDVGEFGASKWADGDGGIDDE